ncbi:MAG: tRNA lysidine(34) synthetase TilS [Proteobacteria bacterium]|nr:tRNA lysidine(34) synthetase TilS [Pseudomonadota bacterium]
MKAATGKIKNHFHSTVSPIIRRITALIKDHNLVVREDKVVVAVSGGADSLALLHILQAVDLHLHLLAVYIDHGLRPLETPHEQTVIKKCCYALEVPFITKAVNVQQLVAQEKRSPEEAARILRYAALENIRLENGAALIAVGHTADDQVEEFFLRLIRGSSKKGLSGMQIRNDRIIRPLLQENKGALTAYLNSLDIAWCQDSSNLDKQFLRNRVRLDLLPLLEQDFNPAIRRTVLQTMDVLAEEEHYLEKQAAAAFLQYVIPDELMTKGCKSTQLAIEIVPFCEYHPAIRRRLLEKCCWHMAIRPTYRQICTLLDFFKDGENGGEIHLEDGVRAEKRHPHLILWRPLEKGRLRGTRPSCKGIHLPIPGPGCYFVPEVGRELVLEKTILSSYHKKAEKLLFLALEKVTFPLLLRTSLAGELFHPCNGVGRKKISRFFNDRKIPAKDRPSWPVLVSGAEIIALPGLQIDHAYRITDETTAILAISWLKRQS